MPQGWRLLFLERVTKSQIRYICNFSPAHAAGNGNYFFLWQKKVIKKRPPRVKIPTMACRCISVLLEAAIIEILRTRGLNAHIPFQKHFILMDNLI